MFSKSAQKNLENQTESFFSCCKSLETKKFYMGDQGIFSKIYLTKLDDRRLVRCARVDLMLGFLLLFHKCQQI
jgi:hypothetical protein